MNDSELNQLLEASKTPTHPPVGFQRDVWFRIQAAEAAAWKPHLSRVLERFLGHLATPSVAFATCTAVAMAGAWIGQKTATPNVTSEVNYVQSISPFAKSHR